MAKNYRNSIGAVLALLLVSLAGSPLVAEEKVLFQEIISEEASLRVVRVIGGLQNPWAVAFLPGERMIISERRGRLYLIEDGQKQRITGLPEITANGQGGLMDVVLHPDFSSNGLIYFSFVGGSGSRMGTRVAFARLSGTRLVDYREIFRLKKETSVGRHFGSRLLFARDGSLFITIGERGERQRAQDLRDHAGATLRLYEDGSIPKDNPFVHRREVLPEIYSYGHRNAQGMVVQPETGWIWQHEHGPRGGDEVNIIEAGKNYGWPTITYGREYAGGDKIGIGTHAPDMEQPVIYWIPSIAPSGMTFYDGEKFPGWSGNLFVGALAGQHLRRLVVEGRRITHQEVLLKNKLGRIRDVRQGPDGLLYLLVDSRNGGLYRIEPTR